MKLNPKLTGGLAWAGLVVVLAVPSADLLSKQNADTAVVMTSDVDPVRTATVVSQPREAAEVATAADPVDQFIQSGKKLPSYISDAPAEVASTKPAPTVKLIVPGTTAAPQKAPLEVASLEPADIVVAPQPYPVSMRPQAQAMTTGSVSPSSSSVNEQPLIIDENATARRDAAVARVLENDGVQPSRIQADELEEWDSGSLAEYLERRGMMSGGQSQQAQASDYDADGFFLDEGPNNDRTPRSRRLPPREFFLF